LPAPSISDKTADPSYKEWFKFKLTIRDRQGNILHIVDQFEDVDYNEGLNLFRLSCLTGTFQTGLFDLAFYDNERIIDMTQVGLGNIVEIEGSKRQDTFKHIFYGFCREIEPTRPGGDILRWRMTGFGSGIILREILMNITRKAKLFDIENLGVNPRDSATQANVLVEDILSNSEFMITGNTALKDLIGCTLNGISAQAVDTVPFLDALNGQSETIIRTICDTVGLVYGLDADNDFYLRYPSAVHSGITIKNLQLGEAYNNQDYAINTAYIVGPYAAPISIRTEDGFANIVRSTALQNRDFISGSSTNSGFKSLAFQALAQRFIPGSLGFSNLAFLLSKVGTVESPKNRINGAILLESTEEIKPSNVQVATFHIALEDVPIDSPAPVEDLDFNLIKENFDPLAPHWVALYVTNSFEWDEDNTPRWHHNGDFVTAGQYSAVATGTSRQTSDPPWQIFPSGPTFAYAAFQTLRHEIVASDPFSVDKYGPIMMDVPNDFIDDTFTMNKYVNTQLSIASVPQIRYSPLIVRIPNDMVFKENTQATFLDQKISATNFVNRQVGIQQVAWNWDAYTTGRPGIKTCELTVLGNYDWYVESEPLTVCQSLQ
jgi:hypothetical protein